VVGRTVTKVPKGRRQIWLSTLPACAPSGLLEIGDGAFLALKRQALCLCPFGAYRPRKSQGLQGQEPQLIQWKRGARQFALAWNSYRARLAFQPRRLIRLDSP
jgi:hypothetical protein